MRVFVTGASGFIGSAVVGELLEAGHEVVGLARSDQSAEALTAAGVEVHRGSLGDLDSLRSGAAGADGVIHLAFVHDDFSDLTAAVRVDRSAIQAIGGVLAGSGRPFVVTSGTARLAPGRLAVETDLPPAAWSRTESEELALALAGRDIRVSVLRLPPLVHGEGDRRGVTPGMIRTARATGVSAYPKDASYWSAVHRLDVAKLFVLALESAPAGSRLHGIDDEVIPVREVAEVIARHLNLPLKALPAADLPTQFSWLTPFVTLDARTSSTFTKALLTWTPTQPPLLQDLEQSHYFLEN